MGIASSVARQDLQRLIGQATSEVTQRRGNAPASDMPADDRRQNQELDGLLFFGNPHETVPRALLLDPRLGHVDKLGWQMMRLLVNPDRATSVPTYEELQPLLRGAPGQRASRATVARVIAILRLTRWVSLGHRARNEANGRIIGNVYILHDEPLSPAEATVFDPDYVEHVCRCLDHRNKVVKAVAQLVLEELQEAGALYELPSRLETLVHRKQVLPRGDNTQFSAKTRQENWGEAPSSQRELGDVLPKTPPSSHREPSLESKAYGALRAVLDENSASTVRVTHCVGNTGTADAGLVWPEVLELDRRDRQAMALLMADLPGDVQQTILDEAAGRVGGGSVRNPRGFLKGLIKRALEGQFVATDYAQHQAQRRGATVAAANTSIAPSQETHQLPTMQIRAVDASPTQPMTTPEEAAAAREACLRKLGLWHDES